MLEIIGTAVVAVGFLGYFVGAMLPLFQDLAD